MLIRNCSRLQRGKVEQWGTQSSQARDSSGTMAVLYSDTVLRRTPDLPYLLSTLSYPPATTSAERCDHKVRVMQSLQLQAQIGGASRLPVRPCAGPRDCGSQRRNYDGRGPARNCGARSSATVRVRCGSLYMCV